MEKTSTPCIASVSDLIGLWPNRAACAADIATSKARVDKWAQVNSIPARFHRSLIDSARARGFEGVTADLLADLHDARSAPIRAEAAE